MGLSKKLAEIGIPRHVVIGFIFYGFFFLYTLSLFLLKKSKSFISKKFKRES